MKLQISAIAITLASITGVAHSASEKECAIWLCAPVGFLPTECHAAHTAMIKRLIEFKSPLPSFSSCEVEGSPPSGIDVAIGVAALMGAYVNNADEIVRPERRIVPGSCNHRDSGPEQPRGCVSTLQSIKIMQNGEQIGVTYYRNKEGADYTEDPVTGVIEKVVTPVSEDA